MDKLKERNYPIKIIKKAQKRARNHNRDNLLESHPRDLEESRLTCVTTYKIMSEHVKKIILKNWRILNSANISWDKPMFSHKRARSLRNALVHTRPQVKTPSQTRTVWNQPPEV